MTTELLEENQTNEFKIDIKELFPKFEDHLNIENNSRILFSGKFGIGKTFFLNEFFENKKDLYEVFHLFPVNYQISSNEDITEFLKYDILVELIKKKENIIESNDYSSFIDLQRLLFLWGKNNFAEIFKTGISFIPKLGKPLKETIELTENFWKFKGKVEAGEKGFIDNFLQKVKKKDISETDTLSELLKNKINNLKGEKQSVLILDDLERIDPEHIFRILNVFSAHLDTKSYELPNKFGFDKIILVADYSNLKSIFHHKYGEETDASGYFDKFFTVEIFQFKNEEIITKFIDTIISKFKIVGDKEESNKILQPQGTVRFLLKYILTKSLALSGEEKLNLRQLLKGIKYPLVTSDNPLYTNAIFHDEKARQIIKLTNLTMNVLVTIFGGKDDGFIKVLKGIKLKLKAKKNKNDNIYFLSTLSFYLLQTISPVGFNETTDSFSFTWRNYSIKYINQEITEVSTKIDSSSVGSDYIIKFLFFDLLIEYIEGEFHTK